MISLIDIIVILFLHWLGDFVLHTDKQAKGKSKNWSDLLDHTTDYSLVFLAAGMLLSCWLEEYFISPAGILIFVAVTFVTHTAIDYVTSRINSRLWEQGRTHDFFFCVGLDQYLHYFQLFVTYYLISNMY